VIYSVHCSLLGPKPTRVFAEAGHDTIGKVKDIDVPVIARGSPGTVDSHDRIRIFMFQMCIGSFTRYARHVHCTCIYYILFIIIYRYICVCIRESCFLTKTVLEWYLISILTRQREEREGWKKSSQKFVIFQSGMAKTLRFVGNYFAKSPWHVIMIVIIIITIIIVLRLQFYVL